MKIHRSELAVYFAVGDQEKANEPVDNKKWLFIRNETRSTRVETFTL